MGGRRARAPNAAGHSRVARGKRFFKLTETGLKIKVIREKGLKTALALKKRKES